MPPRWNGLQYVMIGGSLLALASVALPWLGIGTGAGANPTTGLGLLTTGAHDISPISLAPILVPLFSALSVATLFVAPRWARGLPSVACSALVAIVATLAVLEIASAAARVTGNVHIGVGYGLYLAIVGALAATVSGVVVSVRR